MTSDYFFIGGEFSNQTRLAAWEQDHIPSTVNALLATFASGQTVPDWPGGDYDTIWRITLDANSNLTIDGTLCEGIVPPRCWPRLQCLSTCHELEYRRISRGPSGGLGMTGA